MANSTPAVNPDSILDSTKKVLGIDPSYDAFDVDILMHLNSAFSELQQVAHISGDEGFLVEDSSAEWADVLGSDNNKINLAKSYVYLFVRLLFDPPTTSFDLEAKNKMLDRFAWRLSLYAPPADYSSEVGV